jgi:hypothetical protein
MSRLLSATCGLAVLVGLSGCGPDDETPDRTDAARTLLLSVVTRLSEDFRVIGEPSDNTAAAADYPWLAPEISVSVRTSGGRMEVARFATDNTRAIAEARLRLNLNRMAHLKSSAGCNRLLVTFWNYRDAEQAFRHAVLAKQALLDLFEGHCGTDPDGILNPPPRVVTTTTTTTLPPPAIQPAREYWTEQGAEYVASYDRAFDLCWNNSPEELATRYGVPLSDVEMAVGTAIAQQTGVTDSLYFTFHENAGFDGCFEAYRELGL